MLLTWAITNSRTVSFYSFPSRRAVQSFHVLLATCISPLCIAPEQTAGREESVCSGAEQAAGTFMETATSPFQFSHTLQHTLGALPLFLYTQWGFGLKPFHK